MESDLFKHFESLFEDADARELLPYLEVFLMVVILEVTYFVQSVVYFLLLQELFKGDELDLFVVVLRQAPFRNHHVFLLVPLLELDYSPVVRIERAALVQVAELVRHLPVYPRNGKISTSGFT